MLVVSVRDAGGMPADLGLWIEAWMPRRAGRAGALVALIGVAPPPDVQSGHARAYLENAARRAGLDFLPRERKLPQDRSAVSTRPDQRIGQPTDLGSGSTAVRPSAVFANGGVSGRAGSEGSGAWRRA